MFKTEKKNHLTKKIPAYFYIYEFFALICMSAFLLFKGSFSCHCNVLQGVQLLVSVMCAETLWAITDALKSSLN